MTPLSLQNRRAEADILWPLWLSVLGLMIISAMFIFSTTGGTEITRGVPWYQWTATRQVIAFGIGLFVVLGLSLVDYSRMARWAMVGYWVSIALLLAVHVLGTSRNGARRWLDLGPIQFQPSELAKLTFLFAMANFLARPSSELRSPSVFLKALMLTLLPLGLILKQPDLGSSLVFLPITLVMMLVAGVPQRFVIKLLGGAFLIVSLIAIDIFVAPENWRLIRLQDYQRERLLVYFNADFAPASATPEQRQRAAQRKRQMSWNVEQALISVGSGGFTGKGWREGTQHRLGYLPRLGAHNDFIFSVIAEERGFIGSVAVVTLYGIVLFSGIKTAGESRDRLGRLLATGIVTLFFTHIFVNIGMNIKLMPVTGIPLPLLSAGGTSVLCSLIAVGVLQNIHLYRKRY
jgi:rod shape determining protein RodA